MAPHKTIVWPDVHVPNHHVPSVEAALEFVAYFKPDRFVQLGDFCDWDSVSSYDLRKDSDFAYLEDEVKEANKLLDRIDAALPKFCEKIMIGGNHEDRYNAAKAKAMHKEAKPEKKFTSWAQEYQLERRGWRWTEYGGFLQFGKIIYTHGWASGNNSGLDMSRRFPGKNVIFGHTHQHVVYSCMDSHQLPIEYESIGTLSKFDLSYLRGKPPYNWTRAFTYIYTAKDGMFTKHTVNIINGKFIVNGRMFGNKKGN